MANFDAELARLASMQHGHFSRGQAIAAGATGEGIRSRVENGRWLRSGPGVFTFPGHGDSWERRLWRARLHAGPAAVASHESAGQLHGLSEVPTGRIVLIHRELRRHAPNGVVWHRMDDLATSEIMQIRGIPVTTLPRTAMDLAGVMKLHWLGKVVEEMVVARSVRTDSIGAVLARVRRRGKRGVRNLEITLDALGPGAHMAKSRLELLADHVIDLARLPDAVAEYPIPTAADMRGFVDRCFVRARLIVEADGRRWHERRAAMARDRARDLEAARCGFLTVRLMHEQLSETPLETARALRQIYDLRCATAA